MQHTHTYAHTGTHTCITTRTHARTRTTESRTQAHLRTAPHLPILILASPERGSRARVPPPHAPTPLAPGAPTASSGCKGIVRVHGHQPAGRAVCRGEGRGWDKSWVLAVIQAMAVDRPCGNQPAGGVAGAACLCLTHTQTTRDGVEKWSGAGQSRAGAGGPMLAATRVFSLAL